jgi:hypothetical protein
VAWPKGWEIDRAGRLPSASLIHILGIASNRMCQGPRDRVYAFRSFLNREAPEAFQPDYAKSVLDLYREIVLFAIEHEKYCLSLTMHQAKPSLRGLQIGTSLSHMFPYE